MQWSRIVGHAAAIARLRRSIATERPANAYLLVGPLGVGKRRLADTFAAHLLCASPTPEEPCGSCGHCLRIDDGVHPDLLVTTRDADRRDMRVEQVREVGKWLQLRPLMADRKVAIIDGADDLNEHGQNALLRTLEEPPGRAVLILTARASGLLLPTVRSRCQLLRLDALEPDDIATFLRTRDIAPERATVLAALAQGSPGRALALAERADGDDTSGLLDALGHLGEVDAAQVVALAQQITKGDLDTGLETIIAWYRDVLEHVAGVDRPPRLVDRAPAVAATAARLPLPVVLRILERACATLTDIEHNANRNLAVETFLLTARALERHPVL